MEFALTIFLFGLLLLPVVIIVCNARKQEYDERQELAQTKGYKYGFLTQLAFGGAYVAASFAFDLSLIGADVVVCASCLAGIGAACCYCVWNDAFFGVNTDNLKLLKTLMIIALICFFYGKLSFVAAGILISMGEAVRMNLPLFLTLLSMDIIVIVVNIFIKEWRDRE